MKKIFIVLQFLLVVLVAIYIINAFVKPQPVPDYNPESWNSWKGFFVLSYAGVTKKGDATYISKKQLEEQIKTLEQAGYKTITPDDALAFLERNAPLPEKALLIIFEGNRKDSFIYATPLLLKFSMIATMCIPTGLLGTWGGFYLKEGNLEKISKQAHWKLCSMGNNAIREIPIDKSGKKGHFLSNRMWLGKNLEDDIMFRNRVNEDYDKASKILKRVTGKPITAYLYPFADAGTGANADPLASEINRKAVTSHHKIAFTSADYPFNGAFCNTYNMNRLRVHSNWDGSRLVQELHKFEPRQLPVSGLDGESIWFTSGDVHINKNAITFSPGSTIWLSGSDDWLDLDVITTFRLTAGASIALHIRNAGNDSFLRTTMNQNNIILHERIGTISQTLFWSLIVSTVNTDHKLRLRVKGNRAWVWYNNRLIAGSVPVSQSIVRGKIGISCQNAEIQLLDFNAKPLPKVFAFADSYRSLNPSIQEEISAILPLWSPTNIKSGLSHQQRIDLLTAASSGVRSIPVINIDKDISIEAVNSYTDAIVSAISHPSVKPLITHFAVYGLRDELPSALRNRGFNLVRILSPNEAISFVEQKKTIENDMLLIDGPEAEAIEALKRLLHTIPSDRLIISADSKITVPYGVITAVNFAKIEKGIK